MKQSISATNKLKDSISLFTFLFIVWGFYRLLLFQFPEEIEAFALKPIIWLLPTLYFVKKEKLGPKSLGITSKNLFPSIYLSLILGTIFTVEGLFVNYLKHGNLDFSANIGGQALFLALAISFATAISEEIAFRGFIFNHVWQALDNEWTANIVTSIGWTLIHFPVALLDWKFSPTEFFTYIFLVFVFSVGSSFVFARTKNISSSILLHVLWEWPIILFR